jgi:iron complex transport system ATP-binding protein
MEPMKNTLLSLIDVSVGYQNKTIIKNINADLREETLVVLMGENGIGKSCLLRSIVGLLPLCSGAIYINNENTKSLSPNNLAQTIAVVLTDKVHIEFLKVRELVSLGRSPYVNSHGTLTTEDNSFVDEVLKLMNITEIKNLYFNDLSDGQKQKVLISRALAQDPKVLILDEPATYLDIPSRTELMKMLKLISVQRKLAILLSSHDAELALEFADQVWHIDNSRQLSLQEPTAIKKIFPRSV